MKWVLVLFVLLMNVQFAWSQEVKASLDSEKKINLQVLEKGTRKSLKDINVFLLPFKIKATTNSKGEAQFLLSEMPSTNEEIEIIINITDYKKYSQKMTPPYPENLKLYVEKNNYDYFETTVTDLRSKKDDAQKKLKQEDFLQMPGSGGDPIKAVQNLAGVNRSTGGNARVLIQGSAAEDTLYNIDGHQVPLVFHFGGLSSIVTPEAVESVDYYSAGYGPEFGMALGGHVGLNVRKPKTDRLHSSAFMDIYNLGGLIEGPIDDKSSYLISGRYSYLGVILKAAAKENSDFNLTVAPVFYDFNAQYNYKISEKENFRLFSILSKDQLEFVLNKPLGNDPGLRGNFYQQTDFYRFIPEWNYQIDEDKKISASMGVGHNNILIDIGDNYFNLNLDTITVRSDYENKVSSTWKYNLGVDNEYNWYNVSVKIPSTYSSGGVTNPISSGDLRQITVKGKYSQIGVYGRNEIKIDENSPWTFLPHLRFDRNNFNHELLTQPRWGIRYQWNESLKLKMASGIYHQTPSDQQWDDTFGNPELKTQVSRHTTMGFDKDFRQGSNQGFQWGSSLFFKDLDRLVIPSTAYVTRNGVTTAENYNNAGTGKIQGWENTLKYSEENWSVVTSYTYLQSRRKNPGQNELPSATDQTHSLNILGSYDDGVFKYGTRLRYISGNPKTPIIGAFYDSDNDVYIPQRGEIFSQRDKDFFQIDFRVDRKWIYDTWILSYYLDVQNITGAKNQEGVQYSYDYSQKQEITGLPTIPTVGIKGEF